MKRILIPTDFSKVTENALRVATEIARKTSAEVELLHIIESPNEGEFTVTGESIHSEGINDVFVLKSIEMAKVQMRKIMDDVKYVGVRFIPKIKVGSAYQHFTKHIVKEPADLIIIGTHGSESFLKGIFNSSNAEKVMTKANCMVLSVKNDLEDFRIRNVVFATNFEDDSKEFLNKIKELQNIFDFKIHLVYVNSSINYKNDTKKVENLEKEFVSAHKLENYEFHIVEDLTEYTGITDYASAINADLIAISTHQHKGLHWLGGISEDLVNFAEQPILTYKSDN